MGANNPNTTNNTTTTDPDQQQRRNNGLNQRTAHDRTLFTHLPPDTERLAQVSRTARPTPPAE